MGIPVCAFVFSFVAYSLFRFRRSGQNFEDGPPVRGHKGVIGGWIAVSTVLTLFLIVYPGTIGWLDLIGAHGDYRNPEMMHLMGLMMSRPDSATGD